MTSLYWKKVDFSWLLKRVSSLKEEDQRVHFKPRYLLCLGQFSDHGLRGFDIFHNDKIFFIILDRESFSPANDFQLIALLKSKIEA